MFKRIVTVAAFALLAFPGGRLAHSDSKAEACWRRAGRPSKIDDWLRAAAKMRLTIPIDECEASILASAYFFAHINMCGGAQEPKDHGDRWVCDTKEGYGGAPGPRIIIEKQTGVTYVVGRKKVTNPKEYLKFVPNI